MQLQTEHTLAYYKVKKEDYIYLILRLRGGGDMGFGFIFNDLITAVKQMLSPDGPDYRCVSQGISFRSKCIHPGCVAFNDVIYVTKGLGKFDIAEDAASLKCPKC
jgi:hypothetical protein